MDIDENSTRKAAETYLESWRDKDFTRFRTILADEVEFSGPLAQLSGIDDVAKGMEGLAGSPRTWSCSAWSSTAPT